MEWKTGSEAMAIDRNELLKSWDEAQTALKFAQEAEMKLRKAVINEFYPNEVADVLTEGTKNVELVYGWKLKAVFKINRTLDNSDNGNVIDEALTKIEALGAKESFIAERIVKWKGELVKKEYDDAPENVKKILQTILTEKPGTPQLELVPPKANK